MGKDLKGKELGEGLCQRKNGIYQGRYTDMFGKRRVIYGTDIRALRKELSKLISDNERGIATKEDMTLDMWYNRWLEVYKIKSVKKNTLVQYEGVYARHISPYLGNKSINSIVKSDVQLLIDRANENGLLYETQNKIRVIMLDMMKRAQEDLLIVRNPVSGIQLRAEKEIGAKALTVAEQSLFLDYAKNKFYEHLFYVALNTGLRPGELFALTEEDIDFNKGVINVKKTLVYQKYKEDKGKTFHLELPKTKQSFRSVPMNSICREHVLKQIELKRIVSSKRPKQQNDFLFVTKFNTPLNSVIVSDAIHSIIEEINIKRTNDDLFDTFSPHTFRHTFATRCLESGIEPKVIQKYLGHASIKMTMDLYVHITDDKALVDIEKIVPNFEEKIVYIGPKVV